MAEIVGNAIDILLGLIVLGLGWLCATARDRLGVIVYYISLGTVMSIAWARLEAPDLAIAEAILGAGITGALFIASWAASRNTVDEPRPGPARTVIATLAATIVMGIAAVGLLPLADDAAGLAAPVAANIAATGVAHPVTAVLVDFRSFDTLLELGVLLAALIATWRLGLVDMPFSRVSPADTLPTYARLAVPALVLLAAALLWRGAAAPGGAFQAGATLGAALVLGYLAGMPPRWSEMTVRIGAVLGVGVFGLLGAVAFGLGGTYLDWPDAHAGTFILLVEGGATISIAIALALLVVGVRDPSLRGARAVEARR